MIVRRESPDEMTAEARVAEVGALLARGVRRLRISRQEGLDAQAPSERSCGRAAVDAAEPNSKDAA